MKHVQLILVILFLAGMVILFSQKSRIMNKLSDISARTMMTESGMSDSTFVYEQFNLAKSGSGLKGSFLEFGAKNCSACRRMETVLDEIKERYGNKISIRFFNVTKRDGLEAGRQFGVVAIPMQVLLDRNGKVVYKHVGYISSFDLSREIKNKILN